MDPILGLAAFAIAHTVNVTVTAVAVVWVLSSDERTARAVKLRKAKR